MVKKEEENYYAILGVESGATKAEINRAFRLKSRDVHPDRYKGPDPEGATEDFLRLNRAKEVLDDDKAREAFDALIRAREAHRLKKEAQGAGRKKLREDLEAREEAAKRQRTEPFAEDIERAREQQEAAARSELQREIERLRRTGRLDRAVAARQKPADPPTAAAASCTPSPGVQLTLRWAPETQHTEDSLGAILRELGAPSNLVLALVGSRAMLELPCERDAQQLQDRSLELSAQGLRLSRKGGDAAAPAAGATVESAARKDATPSGTHEALPAGWGVKLAPNGTPYYFNRATRQTQWHRPCEELPHAAAPLLASAEHERLESLTMMRLRQAAERQRLERELAAEGAAASEVVRESAAPVLSEQAA
jgi:DnaJ family protein C protein 17